MTPEQKRQFAADVIDGLAAESPALPCKYLYDERGSELFEAICETEDYYVTRADLALHQAHIDEIAAAIGPEAHIIEFGSGAGIKIRAILEAADRPRAYTAIEISREALAQSLEVLRAQFPEIEIHGLAADYTQPIDNEVFRLDPPARRRVIYFPGSTISNFTHTEAHEFLARMARMAGEGGAVLIGVDLIKPTERLERAYDDRDGITAAFNLNLLTRLERDLDARVNPDDFEHRAWFNPEEQRIEMHLVARRDTSIELNGQRFDFTAGDHI
ncbi:MAG: L-histidine N(alpha)-methyltransferase, partial [Wenzhouxiangellaceae bacterium]